MAGLHYFCMDALLKFKATKIKLLNDLASLHGKAENFETKLFYSVSLY